MLMWFCHVLSAQYYLDFFNFASPLGLEHGFARSCARLGETKAYAPFDIGLGHQTSPFKDSNEADTAWFY